MALNGTYPIQGFPLLRQQYASTQTQVSGVAGIANRTITSPPDFTSLTFSPSGKVVQVNPSMVTPGNLALAFNEAGVTCNLDRFGRLSFPDESSVSGNANLKTALGLS